MNQRCYYPFFGLVFVACLTGSAARADGSDRLEPASVQQLEEEIQDLLDRVEKLEQKQSEIPSWISKWTLKGDLRYRYEFIDRKGKDSRNRNRIRMRIFFGVEVNDWADVGMQIGTTNEDPVSTNETLGRGWEGIDTRFDLAYLDLHPDLGKGKKLNVISGKMLVPFEVMEKSELMWDSDVRPEGMAARFSMEQDGFLLFANAGGFWVQERSSDADTGLFGGQAGTTFSVGPAELTVGSGYYDYTNIEGEAVFDYEDDDNFRGNSDDGAGNYAEDYNLLEVFGGVDFEVMEFPVHVFGNYVNNLAADEEEQGYLAGVKLGSAKDPGSWDFRYQWKVLEKDPVVGAFTDSDFGGGGTDAKGHEWNLNYQLGTRAQLGLTYFLNKIDLSEDSGGRHYKRLQVDFKVKF